jgi:haloalkane dehalogenase
MEILRTPDECFADLPGYPFVPNYVELSEGLRVHYVDEGPRDGEVVLMLHGEPSWSYLYRKMIPVFTAAGLRSIAPDLVGFGRSDKPTPRTEYTYQRHVDWTWEAVERIGVRDMTLIGQDWGSLIGMRLVAEHPDAFARMVIANGFLPTGDNPPGEAFLNWQKFSQEVPEMPIGRIVGGGCASDVPEEVVAAYDAPFPDETYKEGARQFPLLVPTSPDDPAAAPNRKAWESLQQFTKPVLTAFGDSDPLTRGGERVIQKLIPGAKDQPHTTIAGGGHFIQEDRGEELAAIVVDFIEKTPR